MILLDAATSGDGNNETDPSSSLSSVVDAKVKEMLDRYYTEVYDAIDLSPLTTTSGM